MIAATSNQCPHHRRYFDAIVPGEYGISKPWNFCLSWHSAVDYDFLAGNGPDPSSALVEEAVSDLVATRVAVSIRSISKRFLVKGDSLDSRAGQITPQGSGWASCCRAKESKATTTLALDNVSLNLYSGQILALLGHNGAGKSTLIAVLTGLLPSSSGSVSVLGQNLKSHLDEIRQHVGVCPQQDVLFDLLTVTEHLQFFGRLKGVSEAALPGVIEAGLRELQILDKQHARTSTLSGGQKRKLCVLISLMGNSQVVFLDEPTSGMDPYSRRLVWQMLQREKAKRVLILTTHFMDEADLLGDRIAILNHGRLQCVGSSLFVKSRFGTGYHLDLVLDSAHAAEPKAAAAHVLRTVQQIVPSAFRRDEIRNDIVELMLPLASIPQFPALFETLDSKLAALGLSSYGVSLSSLEEVFLLLTKTPESTHQLVPSNRNNSDQGADRDAKILVDEAATTSADLVAKTSSPKTFPNMNEPARDYNLDEGLQIPLFSRLPKDFIALDSEDNNHALASLDDRIEVPHHDSNSADMPDTGLFWQQLRAMVYKRFHITRRNKRVLFCTFGFPLIYSSFYLLFPSVTPPVSRVSPPSLTLFIEGTPSYASPLPVSGASLAAREGVLEVCALTGRDAFYPIFQAFENNNASIPVQSVSDMQSFLLNYSESSPGTYAALFAGIWEIDAQIDLTVFYNTSQLHVLPATVQWFTNLLISRLSGQTTPNELASITVTSHPFEYTAGSGAGDTSVLLGALMIGIGFAVAPASLGISQVLERETYASHVQRVMGVRPGAFWLGAWVFDSGCLYLASTLLFGLFFLLGNSLFSGANFLPGVVLFVVFGMSAISLVYVLSFAFTNALTAQSVLVTIFSLGSFLILVPSLLHDTTQVLVTDVLNLFPPFALQSGLQLLAANDAMRTICAGVSFCAPYSTWQLLATNNDFGRGLLISFISSLLYAFSLMRLESKGRLCFKKHAVLAVPMAECKAEPDSDVLAEEARVLSTGDLRQGDSGTRTSEPRDALQLRRLRKVYSSKAAARVAVASLTLGIPKGEFFGLLGPNGAGKTTTIKMLTGDEEISSGDAFLLGKSCVSDMDAIFSHFGFCPQFNGLFDLMTGREHLRMYATVKGIVLHAHVDALIAHYASVLQLTEHIDKLVSEYSGGTKRKLALAVFATVSLLQSSVIHVRY